MGHRGLCMGRITHTGGIQGGEISKSRIPGFCGNAALLRRARISEIGSLYQTYMVETAYGTVGKIVGSGIKQESSLMFFTVAENY